MDLPSDISSCHLLIKQQAEQLEELRAIVAMLEARQKELEGRLNQNSGNSSNPPSSDRYRKQRKPAIPRKKGLKKGGQKNHDGKTLEMVAHPDETFNLYPTRCACGHDLDKQGLKNAWLKEKRQVFELPSPKLDVYEYRQFGCNCPKCGNPVVGAFPDHVKGRVQYGFGAKALMVILNVGYHMPINKVKSIFYDLFGYPVNESTIISATQTCYTQLESSEEQIKELITEQPVTHLDETGIEIDSKLNWLHVATCQLFTYLFTHTKRGLKALKSGDSIIERLTNFTVHDCWKSYFKFEDCKHALCGAHIIRELVGLDQNGSQWANWFRRLLLVMLFMTKRQNGRLTDKQYKKAVRIYRQIWQHANQMEPQPKKPPNKKGRPKSTKGRNLLKRLDQHQEAVLAFALHQQVPFTNNQAERDLRPVKTKLKVSGCFRTQQGAKIYARVFGFISTAQKHQVNIFKELRNTFTGNNFIISTYGTK